MANYYELTETTTLADSDLTSLVDVSDTDQNANGSTRKATLRTVKTFIKKVATATKAANYTVGTDDPNEAYGGTIYVTSAATITLPAVVAGMSVTVVTIGAVAVSVDPNASDKIWKDGTALDDGDKIMNLSTTGDRAVLTYYSADGWYASTNSWTDGGP